MRIFARWRQRIQSKKGQPARWRNSIDNMTHVSTPAPEWQIQTWFNSDKPLLLSGFRGRVVALCAFQVLCKDSTSFAVSQALRIHGTFEPKDVAVIGLHTTFEHHAAITPAVIKAYLHEYRIKFPVGLDLPNPQGPIPQTMEAYRMRGTPSLVLIDRHGNTRKHAFGPVDDLRLGAEIGALTQEGAAAAAAPPAVARNTAA